MVEKVTLCDAALYQYMVDHSVRQNDDLREAKAMSREAVKLYMNSIPEALNFLQWLVATFQPKQILEYGTFTGLSALAMAQASANSHITTLDHQPKFTVVAEKIWQKFNVESQIDLIMGDAQESSQQLLADKGAGYYDLIFIDADKRMNPAYYEYAIELVRSGGIILVDNIFLKGLVIEPDNQQPSTCGVRTLNETLLVDERVILTSIPLADGMTLVTKR